MQTHQVSTLAKTQDAFARIQGALREIIIIIHTHHLQILRGYLYQAHDNS